MSPACGSGCGPGLVADVPGPVGVHHVLCGHREVRGGSAELLPAGRPVDLEECVGGGTRRQCCPRERDGVPVAAVRGAAPRRCVRADCAELLVHVGEQRPVPGRAHREAKGLVTTEDLDRLVTHPQRTLPAVVEVRRPGDLLQVEVLHVGAEVRESPRDAPVVTDDHPGEAGEREPGDVERTPVTHRRTVQAHLVPDAGKRHPEVGVVGEDRLAGRRVVAVDDPGVGADPVADPVACAEHGGHPAQRPAHALQRTVAARPGCGPRGPAGATGRGVLLEHPVDDGPVVDGRTVPVVGVGREQLRDLRTSVARRHQPALDLVVHVAAQVPGHRLEPGHGVDR